MVSLLCALAISLPQQPAQVRKWKTVTVTKGIKVQLPESAEAVDLNPVKDPKATPAKMWGFTDGKTLYQITLGQFTADEVAALEPDELLAAYISGTVEGLEGSKVKFQRDILFQGWPGLEFLTANKEQAALSHAYLVQKKIYHLMEFYDVSGGRPKDSDEFLNSLVLEPQVEAGPQKQAGPTFQVFSPPDSKCSISMPRKPEKMTPVAGSDGAKPLARYRCQYGNRFYVIGIADVPEEARDQEAGPVIVDEVIKAMGGTMTKPTAPALRNGVQFQTAGFSTSEGDSGRIDVTMDGLRAYVIVMGFPPGHAGAPDIDTFFNSFKLSK